PNQFNRIARRFPTGAGAAPAAAAATPAPSSQPPSAQESEPTVLEDFILQAEIYLQYGMRSKALERLGRIGKLFPGEEQKNEKLRNLYIAAGFAVGGPVHAAAAKSGAAPKPPAHVSRDEESAVDNFARVTEITRNIYRQSNVKSVLSTAVNDIGRHFN